MATEGEDNIQRGGFSTELRDKTKEAHDESDKLINLKLAVVLTDTSLWAKAVAEFYFVFQTIEDSLCSQRDHPQIEALFQAVSGAFRCPSFENDLKFYMGENWKTQVNPSPVVVQYCDRIRYVTEKEPTLLIAYVHSMYLALLAGGQIIRKIVKKTLGLTGSEGLELFNFGVRDRTELRNNIKLVIDGLELSQAAKDAIVAEKIRIFRMNNAIAENIQTTWSNYRRLATFVGLAGLVPVLCATVIWYLRK